MGQIDLSRIRRILVIKLRAVGDVLLSTVVLRSLRAAFPAAMIDFMSEPPAVGLLEANPDITGIVVYDRRGKSAVRYLLDVHRSRYDLVIDLFGNPRTALLTFMSAAPHRVGFDFRGRRYAYTILVKPRGNVVHNTQFNLDALEALGIPITDRSIPFHILPEDTRYVDNFLRSRFAEGTPLVGISFGGGWYTKRWGLDRFAAIADRIVDQFGVGIVLPWGPGQIAEAEEVRRRMIQDAFIPPSTNLRQLGALFRRCAFILSNDSGPMHLAAAVGTPVVGIYGPTNPLLQGPYGDDHVVVRREGLDCLGCNLTKCPIGHPCMKDLNVDMVWGGVEALVKKNRLQLSGTRSAAGEKR
jgi:lipopolysaccharide heptosyltransferase II